MSIASRDVIADQREREQVLDPATSFIVQAPAGSGKTELLMQRYLRLLAIVDEPEEVLAVTFTRKAAAEMRQRILRAIYPLPDDKPLARTAELAAEVRRVNKDRGWQLEEFPARLRVRTLDSVNAWLTASAPATGSGTAVGNIANRSADLYTLAAQQTLEWIGSREEPGPSLRILMRHLDNQTDSFVSLMSHMLACRDQWLPLTGSGQLQDDARVVLEKCLADLVRRELQVAIALIPEQLRSEMCELLAYAAVNLGETDPQSPMAGWRALLQCPDAHPDNLLLWQAAADAWLVKSSADWRKTLNKNNGFPPGKGEAGERKNAALDLLKQLAEINDLAEAFDAIRILPPPFYTDSQWEALASLLKVLPVVAAQLLVVFRERNTTDYQQVAREALEALRGDEGPSRLALRLDYRIRHILIDEFQDTSTAQYELLESLTEGWSDDGQHSLFVVGDPMQSIYRFRQAEVALFLKLWKRGIGQLPLVPVTLTSNFRSDPVVVDWVNTHFQKLFPAQDDPVTGSVRFSPSVAMRPDNEFAGVSVHPLIQPSRVDEAQKIAEIVAVELQRSTTATIGILVRTRNQARQIVPALRAAQIEFSGDVLDAPGRTSVEQDAIALARALTHFADRTAWLALLRAPWCGLTLIDLEAAFADEWKSCVWERLQDPEVLARLSVDGRERVQIFCDVVSTVLARRPHYSLRDWIEGAWQSLGGPACASSEIEMAKVAQVFALLDELDTGGNLAEAFRMHELLTNDSSVGRKSTHRVYLLTMHRAKGLEYDMVILPGLDAGTGSDAKRILAWHEIQRGDGARDYLLAPVEARGAERDPVHKMIARLSQAQEAAEQDRLLYVAATRARSQLHILFGLKEKKDGDFAKPVSGSLLARLMPVIEYTLDGFSGVPGTPEHRDNWVQPLIRRSTLHWKLPEAPVAVTIPAPERNSESPSLSFDWAGPVASKVGTVVHELLCALGEQGVEWWQDSDGDEIARLALSEEGVSLAEIQLAAERVCAAVKSTLADKSGCWILSDDHSDSACEYPVSYVVDGKVRRAVIDRTFVDNDGVRWIVDYKTSTHEGGDLEGFFQSQLTRYAEQLEGYRTAMQLLEPERTVRTVLYFPLLGELRELHPG